MIICQVEMERARRPGHVINRCPMMAVLVVILAVISVTAVVVTLKSFCYNTNTTVKVMAH